MFVFLCLAIPFFKIAMLDKVSTYYVYRGETLEIVHIAAKK